MKVVVVYESMYGNTHLVADAIGGGFDQADEVIVVAVADAGPDLLESADLVVVGGPTHAHGMSRASTREAAVDAAHKSGSDLTIDPAAEGPGLRDWFDSLGQIRTSAAAFDTRIEAPAALTGRASKGIARQLRSHGFTVIADPESFLVTKDSHLQADEEDRARDWGAALATALCVGPTRLQRNRPVDPSRAGRAMGAGTEAEIRLDDGRRLAYCEFALIESGLGLGEVVGSEDKPGAGREVGQRDVHPGVPQLVADLAERARAVVDRRNRHLLLRDHVDPRRRESGEGRRFVLDEHVDLALSTTAARRAEALDVDPSPAKHLAEPCQLTRLVIHVDGEVSRHDAPP